MLIDTHAHINMLSDPDKGIEEAREAGVDEIIIPAASEDDFDAILDICHRYDKIYAALGVHPEDCEKFSDKTASRIIEFARDEKVVAIGEIGLDYHYSKENKEIQKRCFITQLEIARTLNLPVVVHDRDAHGDTMEILEAEMPKKVLMHCFSGSVELMWQCINRGYKIALGGVVTFKNAKEPKNVVADIPLEDLMLETDCPYLTPHPFRGQENSPKYIGFTAKEIARLKEIPYDTIAKTTSENARKFFNLPV